MGRLMNCSSRFRFEMAMMMSRRLEDRISAWLLKPMAVVAPYLRTNYRMDSQTIIIKRPFSRPFSMKIDELDEIGVETTDQGPFVEDVFWILKQGTTRIRIGEPHPIFKVLLDCFGSLEGFDWQPFIEAQSCSDNRYFLCWKRSRLSAPKEQQQTSPGQRPGLS
jgi:hypothetical protein